MKFLRIFTLLLASMGGASARAHAEMKVGDKAPEVTVPLSDGSTFQTSKWLDRAPLVLYFYPKDDTPGCTAEACGLRDDFSDFRNLKATVIGISYDSIASHKKFIEKYKLPFPLAADTDHSVAKAFGVEGILGAKRSTFIIDRTGTIVYADLAVKPREHSGQIQNALKDLAKKTENR